MLTEKEISKRIRPDIFAYIAFWQFMAFGVLIALVWAAEQMGVSSMLFNTSHPAPDYFRASFMSAAVILCAIITVGHTYLQQLYIIRGIIVMCSVCGKIKMQGNMWKGFETYLYKHSNAVLSHGICPECLAEQINTKKND